MFIAPEQVIEIGPAAPRAKRKPLPYRAKTIKPPCVKCPDAESFLAAFATTPISTWFTYSNRDCVLAGFRMAARCGQSPEEILESAERYYRKGGATWFREDYALAAQVLAALDEEPAAAYALAAHVVTLYQASLGMTTAPTRDELAEAS